MLANPSEIDALRERVQRLEHENQRLRELNATLADRVYALQAEFGGR